MDPGIIFAAAVLLLGGGKKAAAAARVEDKKRAARKGEQAEDDGAHLLKRANQPGAAAWARDFAQTGVDAPAKLAEALARWVGLESSGDPYKPSPIGERGIMQIGRATFDDAVKAGIFQPSDWDKMIARTTTRAELARMAYRYVNWQWDRARTKVTSPPGDYISAAWYAYLWHQRPVLVRDMGGHGDALHMARELAARWKGDDSKMHKLRAANVVAFGNPNP